MKSPRTDWHHIALFLFIIFPALLILSSCSDKLSEQGAQSHFSLEHGEINISSSMLLPEENDPNWKPIVLDDNWMESHEGQSGYAWYKFKFDVPKTKVTTKTKAQPPKKLWAVYIPHVNMNAEVWLNGNLLGSGGEMNGSISRNWNYPQYFIIPGGSINAGINQLNVRLVTLPNLGGALSVIHIAPDDVLKKQYNRQYEWQVSSAFSASIFIFIAFFIFSVLWFYCRTEIFFLFSAITSFIWFVNSLHFYFINIPIDPNTLFRIEQVMIMLVVISFMVTISTYFYHRILTAIKYLSAVFFILSLAMFFVPEEDVLKVTLAVQLIAMLSGVIFDVIAVRYAFKTRQWVDYYLAFGMIIGMAFGIHDALGLSGAFDDTYYHMMQFGAFFPMSALAWIVIRKFAHALQVSENYNEELAREVEQKHHELERSFNKLRLLEQDKILSHERERIMRDMHDGIGGQLMSVAGLLQEQTNKDFNDIRKSVQERVQLSLTDLRFVIDSLDPLLTDLPTLLGMMRMRMVDQLEAANIELEWAVTDLPTLKNMSPRRSLHIMRILQEAMTNSIKHSGSNKIKLATGVTDDNKIFIDIIDYGKGNIQPSNNISRGIKNMHYRAEKIDGELHISQNKKGTIIRLILNC